MSALPRLIIAIAVITLIVIGARRWYSIQAKVQTVRDGMDLIHERIRSHASGIILLVVTLLAVLACRNAIVWPFTLIIGDKALINPPTASMATAAISLVALLTFAGSALSSLARDQDSGVLYLGWNPRTHNYQRSLAAASLSTRSFQGLVWWIAIGALVARWTPTTTHTFGVGGTTIHVSARLIVMGSWIAALTTAAALLLWNALTIVRLAARTVQWGTSVRKDIKRHRRTEYLAANTSLLRSASASDARTDSQGITAEIIRILRTSDDEAEHATLLSVTIDSMGAWWDMDDANGRITKALKRHHGWRRRLALRRAPSPAVLSAMLDGRRKILIEAATDVDLPKTTRDLLLKRILGDARHEDSMIRALLDAEPRLAPIMEGRRPEPSNQSVEPLPDNRGLFSTIRHLFQSWAANDLADINLSGILKVPGAHTHYNHMFSDQKIEVSSPVEALPISTYSALAEKITERPCALNSSQLKLILEEGFITQADWRRSRDNSPWDELHQQTVKTARRRIINAILEATISQRAENEPLPLNTMRTLMNWERGVRHLDLNDIQKTGRTNLEVQVRAQAEHILQLTPILSPDQRAELLEYSSSIEVTLTALLHMLLYYGRSGRTIDGADLAPFASLLGKELRSTGSITADTPRHVSDILNASAVSHIAPDKATEWLLTLVNQPLTWGTFEALHDWQRLDLSDTNLCLWWALVNPGTHWNDIDLTLPNRLDNWEILRIVDSVTEAAQTLEDTAIDELRDTAWTLRKRLPVTDSMENEKG